MRGTLPTRRAAFRENRTVHRGAEMTRHVIIGTGIAGYTAAETLRTMNPSVEIVLVSDDPYGFYSRPGLAYYLTGEIPEKQLFLFSKKGKLNLDVNHIKGQVTQIDPTSHT